MFGLGILRKVIGKVISLVFLLIIVAVVLTVFSPAKMIRKSVTSLGPKLTQTSVDLSDISISWLSGKGDVKGLVLGNPEGYEAATAIEIPVATIAIRPTSVFKDKLVIRSIEIESPHITYEGKLSGSNLNKIQENIKEFVGKIESYTKSDAAKKEAPENPEAGKKLQVDEIVIRNAKVKLALTVLGGRGANITLPEIRMTNLGQGPEGISGPEVLDAVWDELVKRTGEKVTGIAGGMGEGVMDMGGRLLKGVGDMLNGDKKE
jgi:uncharacterized protein involved in outer membrane biogenesis